MAIDNCLQVTNSPNLLTFPLYIFVFSCILQICEEFVRITNKDLLGTFRAAVEKYAPQLLSLYRTRKTEFGKDLKDILRKLDDEVCAQYTTVPNKYFCPVWWNLICWITTSLAIIRAIFLFFFFETANIVRHRKEAAMKGLPVFLREDPNLLFKQCLVSINGH